MHQDKSSPITSSTVTSIRLWNLLKPAMNSCRFPSQYFFILMIKFTFIFVTASTTSIHGDLSQNLVKLRSYNYCFISHTTSQSNTDFYLILMKLPFSSSNHAMSTIAYNPYAVLHTQPFINSRVSDFEYC